MFNPFKNNRGLSVVASVATPLVALLILFFLLAQQPIPASAAPQSGFLSITGMYVDPANNIHGGDQFTITVNLHAQGSDPAELTTTLYITHPNGTFIGVFPVPTISATVRITSTAPITPGYHPIEAQTIRQDGLGDHVYRYFYVWPKPENNYSIITTSGYGEFGPFVQTQGWIDSYPDDVWATIRRTTGNYTVTFMHVGATFGHTTSVGAYLDGSVADIRTGAMLTFKWDTEYTINFWGGDQTMPDFGVHFATITVTTPTTPTIPHCNVSVTSSSIHTLTFNIQDYPHITANLNWGSETGGGYTVIVMPASGTGVVNIPNRFGGTSWELVLPGGCEIVDASPAWEQNPSYYGWWRSSPVVTITDWTSPVLTVQAQNTWQGELQLGEGLGFLTSTLNANNIATFTITNTTAIKPLPGWATVTSTTPLATRIFTNDNWYRLETSAPTLITVTVSGNSNTVIFTATTPVIFTQYFKSGEILSGTFAGTWRFEYANQWEQFAFDTITNTQILTWTDAVNGWSHTWTLCTLSPSCSGWGVWVRDPVPPITHTPTITVASTSNHYAVTLEPKWVQSPIVLIQVCEGQIITLAVQTTGTLQLPVTFSLPTKPYQCRHFKILGGNITVINTSPLWQPWDQDPSWWTWDWYKAFAPFILR